MQTAGPGLVAEVSQGNSLAAYLSPGHFGQMIVQRHGVGHNLKPLLQGAVVLAVGVSPIPICDCQQGSRAAGTLPGLVDLQLHSEEPGASAMKDRRGLVVVFMDTGVLVYNMEATLAVGTPLSCVRSSVVGLVLPHQPVTAVAGGIVLLVTAGTERKLLCSSVVSPPKLLAALAA